MNLRLASAAAAALVLLAACSKGGGGRRGPARRHGARRLRGGEGRSRRAPGGRARSSSSQSVQIRAQVSGPARRDPLHRGPDGAEGRRPLRARPAALRGGARRGAGAPRAGQGPRRQRARRRGALRGARRQGVRDAPAVRAGEGQRGRARAQVAADEAAVERAQLNLAYCTIRAPISGPHRAGAGSIPGNLVAAGAPEPLVTIEQVKPVFVEFSVPERHLAALRARRGAPPPVRVRTSGDGPELDRRAHVRGQRGRPRHRDGAPEGAPAERGRGALAGPDGGRPAEGRRSARGRWWSRPRRWRRGSRGTTPTW